MSWKIGFCDFGYGKVMEIYVLAVNKILQYLLLHYLQFMVRRKLSHGVMNVPAFDVT
jgi:hypothetical protein